MAWMSPNTLIPEPALLFKLVKNNNKKNHLFQTAVTALSLYLGGWGEKKKREDNQPILSQKSKFCSKLLVIISILLILSVLMLG